MPSSLLLRAAESAAGAQQYPRGTLYVVATPIGNLADITLRALHVLQLVDALACEDTRVSAGLLRHLGLDKPLLAVHEHNEASAAQQVIERLAQQQRVAYVSDAGTPAISDPGARLVAAVQAAGHRVMPLPGASSVVTALSAAGDVAGTGFRFIGFLPTKTSERLAAVEGLAGDPGCVVLFEAPHRIAAVLAALATALPQRQLTVCRELTKQFETIATMAAGEAPAWLAADANRARGEFVLVVHATTAAAVDEALPAPAVRALEQLLDALPLKQAVSIAASVTGAPRNALYEQALAWRKARGGEADAD